MYLENLIDQCAAPHLLEDCWLSGLPDGQHPPSELELQWFRAFIDNDPVHRNAVPSDQEALHHSALAIERQIPMVSSEGEALSAPRRLYIALEIAKVLFARPRSTLGLLKSVVAYSDAGKLIHDKPEAGIARLRGRNHLVRRLDVIESFWRNLEPLRGPATKLLQTQQHRRADEATDELGRQLRVWQAALTSRTAPDGKRFAEFADTLGREIAPLLRTLARSLAARLNVRVNQLIGPFERVAEAIAEQAAVLAAANELAAADNEASIHFSWFAQMACAHTPTSNVLVHELAHVLDFEHGGIDGAASRHDGAADIRQRWAAAYDHAVERYPEHLNLYGLTNSGEFFAVCSEHYFGASSSLEKRSPELFDVLRATYGYVPHDRVPASKFAVFKSLYLSKLRMF